MAITVVVAIPEEYSQYNCLYEEASDPERCRGRGLTGSQDAEECIVMANEAKILQPMVRVASVYCRIDYARDPSNRQAIVLHTWYSIT